MKYVGEEKTREIVKKSIRKVEYIRCDKCGEKILPSKYRNKKSSYIRVHTFHNDWGAESIESHEYYDYCKSCAVEVVSQYIKDADGTEELELENRYLWEGETVNGLDDGCKLASRDNLPTEKGGEAE